MLPLNNHSTFSNDFSKIIFHFNVEINLRISKFVFKNIVCRHVHVQGKSGDDDVTKRKCRKKSSSINQTLSVAVVNSLWSILTGEKISHGDKRVKKPNENFLSFLKYDMNRAVLRPSGALGYT